MKRTEGRRRVRLVSTGGSRCVSVAGAALLVQTARVTGLDRGLSRALRLWRPERSVLDPGKIVLDLALTLAVGGDCPADAAVLRAAPEVFGTVASDPTISRLIHTLADDRDTALAALRAARATARHRAHQLAGQSPAGQSPAGQSPAGQSPAGQSPAGGRVVVDIDATIVEAFSAKQGATGTFKRSFGFQPMLAYLDHGPGGTGEPLAGLLRPGNANPQTAADHLALLDLSVAQLDPGQASRLLIRTDTAGCSHALVEELTARNLQYSLGFYLTVPLTTAIAQVPDSRWRPARDHTGQQPSGRAELVEVTGLPGTRGRGGRPWPAGLRVIAKRRPLLPGTQLRLGDPDGYRLSAFATNDPDPDLAALELRHRARGRCEDRIRAAKTTGLRNLPYRDFAANAIWVEIVLLAQDLTAFTQQLALRGELRTAEPKRLRLRVFTVAARLVHTARRTRLDLDPGWPWTPDILAGHHRLHALAPG